MGVYTGNANFTTSTAELTQTVQRAPTNTALGSSANPSNYGAPVTLTATVTPAPPSTNPAVLPTGSVAFAIDGTPITTRPLDQPTGTASFSFPSLLPGSHLIRGDYSGDTNFLPSFGALTQIVTCTNNITGKSSRWTDPGPGLHLCHQRPDRRRHPGRLRFLTVRPGIERTRRHHHQRLGQRRRMLDDHRRRAVGTADLRVRAGRRSPR